MDRCCLCDAEGRLLFGRCEDAYACTARRRTADKVARAANDHRAPRPAPFPDAPKGTCRWCAEPIVRGRADRRWHDGREDEPDCLLEYGATQGSTGARAFLRKRDGEVCAACGVDVGELRRAWAAERPGRALNAYGTPAYYAERDTFDRLYAAWCAREPRWAADHIVPLADGGDHGVANLQVLCERHHADKSAREAAARARLRRKAAQRARAALLRAEDVRVGGVAA